MEPDAKKAKTPSTAQMKIKDFQVPCDVDGLNDLIRNGGVKPINELEQSYMASGSNITQVQFAAMRIIFPRRSCPSAFEEERIRKKYGLDCAWETATQLVKSCPEFRAYLALVEKDVSVKTLTCDSPMWPGSLKPVRAMQEKTMVVDGVLDSKVDHSPKTEDRPKRRAAKSAGVKMAENIRDFGMKATQTIRSIRPGGRGALKELFPSDHSSEDSDPPPPASDLPVDPLSYKDSEDESINNAALVLLLEAISDLVLGAPVEWVLNHVHFTAHFQNGRFNAYTDGALRCTSDNMIIAILEVKRRIRFCDMESILMQEGSEMLGFFLTKNNARAIFNNHRVLISQDRQWIFVTFASCHQAYLDYLDNSQGKGRVTKNSYLSMQTFGPWRTENADDMESFAILIAALTITVMKALKNNTGGGSMSV